MRSRRTCLLAVLVFLLLAAIAAWAAVEAWQRLALGGGVGDSATPASSAPPSSSPIEPGGAAGTADAGPRFTVVRRSGPQRARSPRAADVALAREALASGGRTERCGPYALYTDVAGDRLIAACGRIAAGLDEEYARLYGVTPAGEPAEAIFLFRDREGFAAFTGAVAERAGRPRLAGYSGHASASRGYVALHAASPDPEPTLRTLAHELTHLLNRRALGPELPRWLAEGLADGIGDRATEAGLVPFAGVRGSEGEARRLRLALAAGKTGSVDRLLSLAPGEFDRGTVSYDYEQSAMLVRFLLSEPDLAPRFRAALAEIAAGEGWDAERFMDRLGVGAAELGRRFEAWVRASG